MNEDRQKRDWGLIFNTDYTRIQIWRWRSRTVMRNKHKHTFKTFSYFQINFILLDSETLDNKLFQIIT